MSVIKKIILIKYSQVIASGKDAVTSEAFIQEDTDPKKKLFVKGCVDFELYNVGTESIYLWGHVEILPGQRFSPRKSSNLPFATDIQLNWAGDYEITRNVADVALPVAQDQL